MEFIIRGVKYETVEIIFKGSKYAYEVAEETMENEKWLFFLNYLGRAVRTIQMGGILPTIKEERVVAAMLKRIEEYSFFSTVKTETLQY